MDGQKSHTDHVYHLVGEPEQGALDGGYLRYSADMKEPASIVIQKRRIQEYAGSHAKRTTENVVQALPATEEAGCNW